MTIKNVPAELSGCLSPSQPRNQVTGLRTSDFDTLFPQNGRSAEQLIGLSVQLRGENLGQGTWAGRAALCYPNLTRVHPKESLCWTYSNKDILLNAKT